MFKDNKEFLKRAYDEREGIAARKVKERLSIKYSIMKKMQLSELRKLKQSSPALKEVLNT
jgi:hypothetical protein